MPQRKGRTLYVTPSNYAKCRQQVYAVLEKERGPLQKIDLTAHMTYFNNTPKKVEGVLYDHFVSYTKTFPIYDQYKPRENKAYLPAIRENIYNQERLKAVPVLTSHLYGRRPLFPITTNTGTYNKCDYISTFYRRRGLFPGQQSKFSEFPLQFHI